MVSYTKSKTVAESFRNKLEAQLEKRKAAIIREVIEKITIELVDIAATMAINLEEYYEVSGKGQKINISLIIPNIDLPIRPDKEEVVTEK